MSLPKPGDIWTKDFRSADAAVRNLPEDRPIRLVQWNIERGCAQAVSYAHMQFSLAFETTLTLHQV